MWNVMYCGGDFTRVRAESLNSRLDACGWPSAFINGSQDQIERLSAMSKLKKFQCRVLISTDLVKFKADTFSCY